jgi:hypothetical protein
MRRSVLAFAAAIAAAAVVASVGSVPVAGQAARGGKPYAPARTPDGKPDLQGLYNTATLTPLERPAGDLTMTEDDARRVEEQARARREQRSRPSDPTRSAPPIGGDGNNAAGNGGTGGYNNFWVDPGDSVIVINGERRASLIVDPPDGRVPAPIRRPGAGRGAAPAAALAPTSDAPENVATVARGAFENPEQRPLAERCLLGFGSTSGPPALPVLYNNFKQIVQTPEHVMILTEMNHDARIVRMNQPHRPKELRSWLGDPVGRWEGDTLVVETTNFTEKTRFRGSSADLKVTERFSRLDDKTLLYRFTVEDPNTWAQPWSGEYVWRQADPDDHLYEYACHEGNYSFAGILRGERLLDKERAVPSKR